MKTRTKLVVGSILALTLGLVVSLPILFSNLALVTRVKIEVDVVYAYFGVQNFNQNVTGLWRNATDLSEQQLISYFIVLNVTNHSNTIALMDSFEVSAAPEIYVHNVTDSGFGVSQTNPIVDDFRDVSPYYPGWDNYWSSNKSKLIGLSGIVEVSDPAYLALTSGRFYLFGKVNGHPFGGGTQSAAYSLKYVQAQTIGREFLYNSVLSENQIWRTGYGLDVFVDTRR
jgi:hypothetical protein